MRLIVTGKYATAGTVAAYLPGNYSVTGGRDGAVIVEGEDHAGWTAEGYVIPRLASGMMVGREEQAERDQLVTLADKLHRLTGSPLDSTVADMIGQARQLVEKLDRIDDVEHQDWTLTDLEQGDVDMLIPWLTEAIRMCSTTT
jgi:hypothetical protein